MKYSEGRIATGQQEVAHVSPAQRQLWLLYLTPKRKIP